MKRRRPLKPDEQGRVDTFVACAVHALPHRRRGAQVINLIGQNIALAMVQNRPPFISHCNLAWRRDVQHRNTSRGILEELKQLGFVRTWWTGRVQTFAVNWNVVFAYLRQHHPQRMTADRDDPVRGPARTKADWDRERAEHKAVKRAAAPRPQPLPQAACAAAAPPMSMAERKAAAAAIKARLGSNRRDDPAPKLTYSDVAQLKAQMRAALRKS